MRGSRASACVCVFVRARVCVCGIVVVVVVYILTACEIPFIFPHLSLSLSLSLSPLSLSLSLPPPPPPSLSLSLCVSVFLTSEQKCYKTIMSAAHWFCDPAPSPPLSPPPPLSLSLSLPTPPTHFAELTNLYRQIQPLCKQISPNALCYQVWLITTAAVISPEKRDVTQICYPYPQRRKRRHWRAFVNILPLVGPSFIQSAALLRQKKSGGEKNVK